MTRGAPGGVGAALVAALDEAYDVRSWHGPNLRGSLRGVRAGAASWRPAPGRHNIWELVVHAAYWKYAVRRRLMGEKRGAFPLAGTNFFARPADGTERAWREDLALLDREHRALRAALLALPSRSVTGRGRRALLVRWLARGIAAHDLYHAGQIQLLKRLRKAAG